MLFHRHIHDAPARARRDPTVTLKIRMRYRVLSDTRWRKFAKVLKAAVIDMDILGLKDDSKSSMSLLSTSLPLDGKLRVFQSWLDASLARVVLEHNADYLDPAIDMAYRRAVARGMKLTKTTTAPPNVDERIAALQHLMLTEFQGIIEAVSQNLLRIGSDAIINKTDSKTAQIAMNDRVEKIGVTRSRQMIAMLVVKANSTGLLDQFAAAGVRRVGVLPETFKKKPKPKITKDAAGDNPDDNPFLPGNTDNPFLENTIINPAQPRRGTSPSTISRISKEEAAVESAFSSEGGDDVQVEVLTAGDDLVCAECEEIAADGPYDIDEARSLIPAHPDCRCSFVPEGSSLFGTLDDGE